MSPRDAVESPPLETFQTWLFIAPSTPTWWWLAKPAISPGLDDLQRFSTESVTVYPVGSSDIENLEKKIKDLGLDHIFIYIIWGHLVLGTYHSAMISSYPYVLSHRRCQNIWEILPYLQKKKKNWHKQLVLHHGVYFLGHRHREKMELWVWQFWEVCIYIFHFATQRCSLEKINKAQIDKLPTVPAQVLLLIALPGVEGFY